jgi:hypothetical protein
MNLGEATGLADVEFVMLVALAAHIHPTKCTEYYAGEERKKSEKKKYSLINSRFFFFPIRLQKRTPFINNPTCDQRIKTS